MNILPVILCVLLVLGVLYTYIGYKEGFSLQPADFPSSVEHPILFENYPLKQNPQLSNNSYGDNSKMKSYTKMSSYEQKTNNKKNWVTPDNGTCIRADFCGTLYDNKNFDLINSSQPNDVDGVRVNFYTQS